MIKLIYLLSPISQYHSEKLIHFKIFISTSNYSFQLLKLPLEILSSDKIFMKIYLFIFEREKRMGDEGYVSEYSIVAVEIMILLYN